MSTPSPESGPAVSTDPSLAPDSSADILSGPSSPTSPEATTTVELTPELAELERFRVNIERVRFEPTKSADYLYRLGREIFVKHANGTAGSLVVSKTIKLIEAREHGQGLGAKKRNSRTSDPHSLIGSDKKKHRSNISYELRTIHDYMVSASNTLRSTAELELSDEEVELYAAAMEYAENLSASRLPQGYRDNLSGYDGKHNKRHANLEDVANLIKGKVAGYHDLETKLSKSKTTLTSKKGPTITPKPGAGTDPIVPAGRESKPDDEPPKKYEPAKPEREGLLSDRIQSRNPDPDLRAESITKPADKPSEKAKEKSPESKLSQEDIDNILAELEKDPEAAFNTLYEVSNKRSFEDQAVVHIVHRIAKGELSLDEMSDQENVKLATRIVAVFDRNEPKHKGH